MLLHFNGKKKINNENYELLINDFSQILFTVRVVPLVNMTATCRFASIFHKLSHNLRNNQSNLLLNNVHRSLFHTSQVLGLREGNK